MDRNPSPSVFTAETYPFLIGAGTSWASGALSHRRGIAHGSFAYQASSRGLRHVKELGPAESARVTQKSGVGHIGTRVRCRCTNVQDAGSGLSVTARATRQEQRIIRIGVSSGSHRIGVIGIGDSYIGQSLARAGVLHTATVIYADSDFVVCNLQSRGARLAD